MTEGTERHPRFDEEWEAATTLWAGGTMGGGIIIRSQVSGSSAKAKTTVVYAWWEGVHGGDVITARDAPGSRKKGRDTPWCFPSNLPLVLPIA